jgi:transcriptional regulator with GAF, ATPase, and Fis domain
MLNVSQSTPQKISINLERNRESVSLDPLSVILSNKKETDFIRILEQYEAVLESCQTQQEVVDNTNQFLKNLVQSECACVRSAENNKELVFKTVTCPYTQRENRAYRLEDITIITRAARQGVSILEDDQKNHTENGRPNTDSGSLLTVSLPLKDLHSPRLQLTACDFQKFGLFNEYQAIVVNFILRRMSDAYLARRYSELHPILMKSAARMDMASRHRMFGSSLFEAELGEMINRLQITHNTVFLIKDVPAWPKLLHTEAPIKGRDTMGLRPLQVKILETIRKEVGGYVWREGNKIKIYRAVDEFVEDVDVPDDWPQELSVAVAPVAFDTEFFGFLWLERQGDQPFTSEDLAKLEQLAVRRSSNVFVRAIERVGRPRVHFVALPSNPKMKEVQDKIHLAIQYPQNRVLLVGETGTGKELVARIIHDETPNRSGKYEAIDPAAAKSRDFSRLLLGYGSKGKADSVSGFLHRAIGGTLVLDQLESFSESSLTTLLRVLAESEYRPLEGDDVEILDARVIGIVTGNLQEHLKKGPLSQDIINRIRGIEIHMPPLRERKEEIEIIIDHWLRIGELSQYERKLVPKNIIELFKKYSWPGNLRELKEVVEAMCMKAGVDYELTPQHFDPTFLERLASEGITVDPPAA